MSLTLKITSLFVRTLAKPVANTIKRNAHEHEKFRKICVRFAQGLHRIDMRMRLGLLQDPAVIDRQIAKEVAAAEAARRKEQAPTVKTEEEMKADEALTEKEREAIKKKAEAARKPRIRPLTEAKAIETGANFVAETFIFSVGILVIVVEQWRQRRKARNARDDIREDLEELQVELETIRTELKELKARHPEPKPTQKDIDDYRLQRTKLEQIQQTRLLKEKEEADDEDSILGKLIGFWRGAQDKLKETERESENTSSQKTPQSQPPTSSPPSSSQTAEKEQTKK